MFQSFFFSSIELPIYMYILDMVADVQKGITDVFFLYMDVFILCSALFCLLHFIGVRFFLFLFYYVLQERGKR